MTTQVPIFVRDRNEGANVKTKLFLLLIRPLVFWNEKLVNYGSAIMVRLRANTVLIEAGRQYCSPKSIRYLCSLKFTTGQIDPKYEKGWLDRFFVPQEPQQEEKTANVQSTSLEPFATLEDSSFCGDWRDLYDGALGYGSMWCRPSIFHEEKSLPIPDRCVAVSKHFHNLELEALES